MKTVRLNTKVMRISDLLPDPCNPRVPQDGMTKMGKKLKKSMATWGYVSPIVYNERTKLIVSGHQRGVLLREMGIEEVEVQVVDLPVAQARALGLACNAISGDWDIDKLPEVLESVLQDTEVDLNIHECGFELDEISKVLDTAICIEEKKADEEDEESVVKDLESVCPSITEPGQLIELRGHKILCADATKPENWSKLLGTERIGCVHIDLPYNCDYNASRRPTNGGKNPSKWAPIANDNLDRKSYIEFVRKILENSLNHLDPGASIYLWVSYRCIGDISNLLDEMGCHLSNIIVWAKKGGFSPGFTDYQHQVEYLLYGWKKDNGPHKWYGKAESNHWLAARESTRSGNLIHPTMKPVELGMRVLKNSTLHGDILIDACAGAGFNLIAAERMGRKFRGMELCPANVFALTRRFIRTFGPEGIDAQVLEKYGKGI